MAFHERENDAVAILWGEEHGSNNGTAVVSPKGLRYYDSTVSSVSSWSDLSSPFGSELESTTESEEDEEFISELTRKMAESMLQDDDEEDDEPKQQAVQDPEAGVLPVNWSESGRKSGSVCYNYISNQGFVSKSGKPNIETVSNVNFDENSADEHVNELKKQEDGGVVGGGRPVKAADTQREKQSTQSRGGRGWKHGGQGKKNSIPVFPAPQVGSGMRAVFLGGSDRNGCSGTGVFLPTGGGYVKPEPKRKPGT